MSRLSILLLIVVLLIPTIATADDYTSPDDSELWAWWLTLSMEEKTEQIRNMDIIEHTTPEIKFPEYNAILTDKNDLVIFPPENEFLDINIYYLSYEAELPTYIIPDFYQAKTYTKEFIITGAVSFGIGLLLGIILE